MGSGEWGMVNGEWGVGSGEWETVYHSPLYLYRWCMALPEFVEGGVGFWQAQRSRVCIYLPRS